MRIVPLARGVVLLTQVGNNDAVTLASFGELTAEIRRAGSLTVFADARWTKRMSPELRDTAVKWAAEHRSSLRTTTVLVASKLMDMALSVLAMLVGGGLVKTVSEPTEFERRIRQHAPNFSGLPELEAPPHAPNPDAANRTP
ncbi:MAG TPA: hypothetical protein VMS65_01690 [Polyangiaceae bacterium]|nr:hypothetical protein [Polyangiaceae bacterium]